MKKINLFLAFLLVVTISTSCKKEGYTAKIVTLKVASTLDKVSSQPPATVNNPAVILIMNIIELETNENYHLDLNQISGFSYVTGFEYILKVKKTSSKNHPADGPIESYELIQVISKI